MTTFGAIPTDLICRFGELTKTEIIVVSFLYAARNRTSGKCNPKQKTIAEMTGIDKAHISKAIRSLWQSGWISPLAEGGFLLESEPKKVAKSATIAGKNKGAKVAKSATQVAKSATESCEIRNSIYRKNTEGTYKEHNTLSKASEWSWPMKPLVDAFPDYLPDRITPALIGFVESDVKPGDEEAWAETIEKYKRNFDPKLNRYLPDKPGTLLDVFKDKKSKLERERTFGVKNDRSKQRDTDKRNDRESTEDYLASINANPL